MGKLADAFTEEERSAFLDRTLDAKCVVWCINTDMDPPKNKWHIIVGKRKNPQTGVNEFGYILVNTKPSPGDLALCQTLLTPENSCVESSCYADCSVIRYMSVDYVKTELKSGRGIPKGELDEEMSGYVFSAMRSESSSIKGKDLKRLQAFDAWPSAEDAA